MNTDNFFSLSRFNKVLCNLFVENWKLYLHSSIGIFAVFIIFDIVYCFSVNHNDVYGVLRFYYDYDFMSGLANGFMIGIISVSAICVVKDMSKKSGRILVLTSPATTFEKWLSRWIVCTPFSLLVFFIIFFAVCGLHIIVFRYLFPQMPMSFPGFSAYIHSLWLFLTCSLFIQSLCMLSAFFSPRSPAKLIITIFFSVLLLGIVGYILASTLSLPVVKLYYQIGKAAIKVIFVWSFSLLAVIGWALSYISFKKMEIIDR